MYLPFACLINIVYIFQRIFLSISPLMRILQFNKSSIYFMIYYNLFVLVFHYIISILLVNHDIFFVFPAIVSFLQNFNLIVSEYDFLYLVCFLFNIIISYFYSFFKPINNNEQQSLQFFKYYFHI